MKKHVLQAILESIEVECRSYSGRGMFGKECLGVSVSCFGDFIDVYTEALLRSTPSEEEKEYLFDAVRYTRTDSLGNGMIIYFPDVQYVCEDYCDESRV